MANGKKIEQTGQQQLKNATRQRLEKDALKKMMTFNRQFMETNQAPELQEITELMRVITGADYAFLNILDESTMEVVTEAVAGAPEYLLKISKILGFNLVGKRWPYDPARKAAIEANNLTTFENLQSSMGNVMPLTLISLVEKTLDLGQVVVIKINKLEQAIGEFTLFMHRGQSLLQPELADLFASQVGLYLDRSKNLQDLQQERQRLDDIIEATHVGTYEYNMQTGETAYNDRWAEMLGYSLAELQPTSIKNWNDMIHPEDHQKAMPVFRESAAKGIMHAVEVRMKHKEGHWVWVEARGKVISRTEDGKPLMMRGTHTDITERKEMELALAQSEKTYRAYVDKSPLAIFVTDGIGRYLRANPAASELTGYTEEELKKLTIFDLAPPDEVKRTKQKLVKVEDTGTRNGEFIGLKKNGDRYWGHIHLAQINEHENIGFVEDITDRIKAEKKLLEFAQLLETKNKELEAAVRDAITANEAKSRYLAHMNHEMRTPLNGFLGFLQLMEFTQMDEEQQEFMLNMKQSASHMLNIINNVLDYARIEAGEMKLNNRIFHLEDEIDTALAPLRSLARQNNLHLKLTLAKNLPHHVVGDPDRLRQIILNLGGNAVKFTEKGQVHMTIECRETNENHHLRLVVEDTGPGMTQETLTNLFQPFYQADDGTVPQTKGTGLGMAITRELVELMDGEINVVSTLGQGTRVEVGVKLFKK